MSRSKRMGRCASLLKTSNTLLRQNLKRPGHLLTCWKKTTQSAPSECRRPHPTRGGLTLRKCLIPCCSHVLLHQICTPGKGACQNAQHVKKCRSVVERQSRDRLMGASSSACGHSVAATKATSRVLGTASLMRASKTSPSLMSNHPGDR